MIPLVDNPYVVGGNGWAAFKQGSEQQLRGTQKHIKGKREEISSMLYDFRWGTGEPQNSGKMADQIIELLLGEKE